MVVAGGPSKSVKVSIAAKHQPVPPEALAGLPFRPVEFDGLTVTPYVQDASSGGRGRPKVAYSLRASAMRAPGKAATAKGAAA